MVLATNFTTFVRFKDSGWPRWIERGIDFLFSMQWLWDYRFSHLFLKTARVFFFFTPFLFSFSFLLFFFFSNSNCTHSSLYQNHSWPWKLQFCYRSQLLNISFYKKLINKIWSNRWIPIGQGRNSNQCRGQEEWTREREMIWNTCPEHTMWNWTDTHSLFGQRNSRRWINDHLESRFCS